MPQQIIKVTQGSVPVQSWRPRRIQLTAVEVELADRAVDIEGFSFCNNVPGVILGVTNDSSLKSTFVEFPKYTGWKVYAASIQKYTLSIALMRA